ncbi:hypothetical protein BO86DRAFT_230162 [Aspergillus japonicus CBS 114.51]|uniref:Uncharacterized protein n=2 Tax=Aspergillus TaxID=5052 RepID=A0A2V5GU35_ASPV1|nr:hypothetical protein BO86DRAFT_230162 [Aspergillus japonicus CBS 114.51]PYI14879.1 hypothetical protein BO99DRAFT_11077 [Aspergillus violaceofuscus CBS 115571]RAH84749.1 hypothetical protein BO86DRAFT_230162 [Aspergillus japonicus CBS 114.51]
MRTNLHPSSQTTKRKAQIFSDITIKPNPAPHQNSPNPTLKQVRFNSNPDSLTTSLDSPPTQRITIGTPLQTTFTLTAYSKGCDLLGQRPLNRRRRKPVVVYRQSHESDHAAAYDTSCNQTRKDKRHRNGRRDSS